MNSFIQINQLFEQIGVILIAVTPTVYIFSVTLLGKAIEQAQREEKTTKDDEEKKLVEKIEKVKKQLVTLTTTSSTVELEKELHELKQKKEEVEKKVKKINNKYNRITLRQSVILPVFAVLLALIVGKLFDYSSQHDVFLNAIFSAFQLILLSYGGMRVILSLLLVQEISILRKESEYQDQMKETIKSALSEYEISKKAEVGVQFQNVVFPLHAKVLQEIEVKFFVELKKAEILHDASVWFFIADGIGLVDPSEASSWRQASDFSIPNIRTIKVSLGKLNKGIRSVGKLKVIMPGEPGTYSIRYVVHADGYKGVQEEKSIVVEGNT